MKINFQKVSPTFSAGRPKNNMSKEQRLIVVLVMNVLLVASLLVVGLKSHSLGVLAAGGDYLADAAAIGVSIIALRMSLHPHGHPRATTYAAIANALVLLVVTVVVSANAAYRLLTHTPQIEALPVVIVSAIAGLVMVIGAIILNTNRESDDLNMRAVLLDTIADAAAAGGVVLAGVIILVTREFFWLDSIVALVISLVIARSSLKLMSEAKNNLRAVKVRKS